MKETVQDIIGLSDKAPLSLTSLTINLIIGLILALALRAHFRKFGSTLSNREELSQVFPFVALTTILIITVVKSSIALSLGLVGALSIVRFRTPVKEPEELAYLFLSIAIGLGLGAGQVKATVIAVVVILVLMGLLRWDWKRREVTGKSLFLSIDGPLERDEAAGTMLEQLNGILRRHARGVDLRRYDVRSSTLEATYLINLNSTDELTVLLTELKKEFPVLGITFLDQNQLPGI